MVNKAAPSDVPSSPSSPTNPNVPISPNVPSSSTKRFTVVANSKEEEDAFDYVAQRTVEKPTGFVGSVAHLVKGALGGGILSGHVAYMKGGVYPSIALTIFLGTYMGYCLFILVKNAQILYKRTHIPSMSYPDIGEAAFACFPNPKVSRFSKCFRYTIDTVVSVELFGACAAYQLVIAKTIKQFVERIQQAEIEGKGKGYPSLRVYLAAMIIPCILICQIRHLKWLAPFSIIANFIIMLCIGVTIYFAIENNPKFEKLLPATTDPIKLAEFAGINCFSMSCAGVVVSIENNMKNPKKFGLAFFIGMILIMCCVFLLSFFGYVAYLDECKSPITVNFPITTFPNILKGLIALMIFVTHSLNFWVPFNLCFYYIKKKLRQDRLLMWEHIFRAIFVVLIALVAITFPDMSALLSFIGCLCLSNMAFIWPNIIEILVTWHRPGFGKYKWRLWKNCILLFVGFVILILGSAINGMMLFKNTF